MKKSEALGASLYSLRRAVEDSIDAAAAPLRASQSRLRDLPEDDLAQQVAELVRRAESELEPLPTLLEAATLLHRQDLHDTARQLAISAADHIDGQIDGIGAEARARLSHATQGIATMGTQAGKIGILRMENTGRQGVDATLERHFLSQAESTTGIIRQLVGDVEKIGGSIGTEAEQVIEDIEAYRAAVMELESV